MNEHEYIESIDCCFPYAPPAKWRQAIKMGVSISANSAFMALLEIARPPRSTKVSKDKLVRMVEFWSSSFQHPLAARCKYLALCSIRELPIPLDEVLADFAEIQPFRNQYNALALVYFSAGEPSEAIEQAYDSIVAEWETSQPLS